jgi:Kef-type K+ transport system membrane component KefB
VAKLEDLIVVLLLPAFFAFTGLRTQIGLVNGAGLWLVCGVIILVASLGKFGGSAVASRLSGMSWRDSAALGILMNTRGLMELIVLNIGFELGVISPTLFAMLVLMALVTTFATTPVLHLLSRGARATACARPGPGGATG